MSAPSAAPIRPRNDPRQYDDLADEWWAPRGGFAMLHWIAAARARLIPAASRDGAVLLDVACGGGVLAPHIAELGYRHVGVDLSPTAAPIARRHGVEPVRGDALALPFADEAFDVVVAGEVLEHVTDHRRAVAESCRVLRPGGTLVIDTIAATRWGRFISVTVAERIPAGPPKRLHDPELFVDRDRLVSEAARNGVHLTLNGLQLHPVDYVGWLLRRRENVRMIRGGGTAALFQAVGVKEVG
ncbi:MAG: 2-polyprenyl-6-hydroxyphenyl methylase / 3-demethylubiquinone-9 3-methyltransferase [Frankiales bacterium]|jgi:2-polyprenyl-6-hydroxyphenyl methylase/3-demethylubiquinone-9 3-methyltransferase|nr:2-polyprenyl-6-hydroxyphenyl methylase / 3-demethylubiquinone-9 3-methyltransferase [Frankiales bacterium]